MNMTPQEEIDIQIKLVELALIEKRAAILRRELQSQDQDDIELAFAADRLPEASQSFGVTVALHEMRAAMRLPNTRGFEPA